MSREALRTALGNDSVAAQTANCLYREYPLLSDCTTADECAEYLAELTADDLLDIRNVGPVSVARIKRFLATEGRTLREYPV